jgi:hypothetical protein
MRMRLVAALLLLSTALAALPAHATGTVTVSLSVNASLTFPYDEPAFVASCNVTVLDGSTAADVLDQAKADGCIADWSAIDDPTFGRFLHGITKAGSTESTDGRNEYTARFLCGLFPPPNPGGSLLFSAWGFGIDGAAAPTGIDGYTVADGDAIQFHYIVDTCTNADNLSFIVAGTWPTSPILLEGNADTEPGAL